MSIFFNLSFNFCFSLYTEIRLLLTNFLFKYFIQYNFDYFIEKSLVISLLICYDKNINFIFCSADVMKLADMLDLGSNAKACRFKSCHPHQTNIIRTYFQSVIGSDYLFSLNDTKAPTSATE